MAIPQHIKDLIEGLSEKLRQAFLSAINDIKSNAKLEVVTAALEAGKIDDALRALNIREEFFEPLDDAIRAAYLLGGRDAAAEASSRFPKSASLVVRFSGRNVSTEEWIKDRSSRLIGEISNSTREAIRSLILEGMTEGRNPRDVALDLVGRIDRTQGRRVGGVIGLNSLLTGYVQNARQDLESGDTSRMKTYLERAARDKRYDSTVQKAIDAKKPVPADKIAKIAASYSDNFLRYRGEMIGRTEAMAALNAARHEAVRQMVDAGQVEDRDITRRWRSAGWDGRTRDTHLAMHDQVVQGMWQPFISPSGAQLMHPSDASLGAGGEEIINCRCYEEISIDYVAAQARIERG